MIGSPFGDKFLSVLNMLSALYEILEWFCNIFFQENERLTLIVELHKNKKGSKKPSDHTRL